MAAPTLEELKNKATALNIPLKGDEKANEIKALIEANSAPVQTDDEAEKTPEELEAESKKAQEAFAKQQADKKAGVANANERTYTAAEVKAMLEQVAKQAGKTDDSVQDDDERDLPKVYRLPRFQNKFVIALKNMNTDEYFPDQVIQAYDIWDDKTRQNIPWVTLMFADGTELSVPHTTAMKRSQTIPCEIVGEPHEVDVSYDFGKVEKVTVDGYESKGSGELVRAKVTQKRRAYDLKLPNGQVVTVGDDVINW